MNLEEKLAKSEYTKEIQGLVRTAESLRKDKDNPVDVTLEEVIQEKFQISEEQFMADLGLDPSKETVSALVTIQDVNVRWLIPEIYRKALRLGYRNAPIYPNIIAGEEQMRGLTQKMPYLNMSDAAPRRVGEGETIPLGAISYGEKSFDIYKIGRGISMTYEMQNYSSLKLVSMFLEDFGVKLGHAMDTLAISTLINGEQADGSESAPVIGTATGSSKTYADYLTIWTRLARMGRFPTTMIGGEAAAILTLNLTEFKTPVTGAPLHQLKVHTPIPKDANYFIHGDVPASQEIILDPNKAIIKFNAQPLLVESEKIVSNQTEAFYATLTTGFAKMFRDASMIMDASKAFSSYGFPSYMDVDPLQNVTID